MENRAWGGPPSRWGSEERKGAVLTVKCLQPRRSSPNIWEVRGTATLVRGATVGPPPSCQVSTEKLDAPDAQRQEGGEGGGKEGQGEEEGAAEPQILYAQGGCREAGVPHTNP